MRKSILTLFLLLICWYAMGQHQYKEKQPRVFKPTKAQEALIAKYEHCTNLHRYNATERRAFFPFGLAKSIRLVSYESIVPNRDIVLEGEQPIPIPPEDTVFGNFFPMGINKFKVNYCRVVEIKELKRAGIDSLTDILYNVGYTPVKNLPDYPNPGYKCYSPRNAILFLDAAGNVTQYIEFCFGCKRYFYSSSKTKPIDYCEQKFDILREFFLGQGLKFGTKRDDQD